MRFAILGKHPDGVAMAEALVASGRYQLAAYTTDLPATLLAHDGSRKVQDLEEVLADPQIELVIVAGVEENRPTQLRRALQAERHVLVVHPPDRAPEVAYEAGMIQKDTGRVLLPLLPDAVHPGIIRLRQLLASQNVGTQRAAEADIGTINLLQMTRKATNKMPADDPGRERKPSFHGWDVLRALGGEIKEVSAFAESEEIRQSETSLVGGRFEHSGLFQMTFLAGDEECLLVVNGSKGRAELYFPQGCRGPAFLSGQTQNGELKEEAWQDWDPWSPLVSLLDNALAASRSNGSATGPRVEAVSATSSSGSMPASRWEDEIRCLELDDATRRSIERRRSSLLDYQEASEEVGFKGTMTLVGCAMMWGLLALLVVMAVVAQGIKSSKSDINTYLPPNFEAATCVGLVFGAPLFLFLLLQLLKILLRKNS
jgi:predicted dehydrogenase